MKTALVTGGGSGIGQAMAISLAEQGVNTFIVGRRQPALEVTKYHHPDLIHAITADVSSEQDIATIVYNLKGEKLDFLIHNAGIEGERLLLTDMTRENWESVQRINLAAPMFLTQALLSHFKPNARILLVSSGLAHHAIPYYSAYCTSKAGLNMLAKCLNVELNAKQVFTGILDPGPVDTDMQVRLREKEHVEKADFFKQMKDKNMLAKPQSVAEYAIDKLFNTKEDEFKQNEWVYS